MIFFSAYTNYMMLCTMSVTIVQMVGKPKMTYIPVCIRKEGENATKASENEPHTHKVYDWTEQQRASIMSAYFYGYMTTIIAGGLLSEWIGPFHVVLWSSALSAISTAVTPVSADLSYIAVVFVRVIVGMCGVLLKQKLIGDVWYISGFQGVTYPALNTLMARWAPPKEKGKFVAASLGNTFGMVITFMVVGVVTQTAGWPWGFYVTVVKMGVFCVFWSFVVADYPEKSKWTSQQERDYILESQEGHLSRKKHFAPLLKILSSKPFLILTLCQFGSLWGLYTTVTYTPAFLSQTIGLELDTAAALAGLPYLSRGVCSFIFGFLGDRMRRNNVMSVTNIRKFFTIFSHFVPAVCCFLVPAAGCSAAGVVVLIVIMMGSNGSVVVSNLINPQDLAPNFAGTVFGIMQTVGTVSGVVVPVVTGALLDAYNKEYTASIITFVIAGSVYVVCGLAFVIGGSGEVQPWNEIIE